MTQDTNTASGAADLPEALTVAVDCWFAKNTGLGGCSDKDVRKLADIFRIHALAAGQATAAQQGVAYAALPEKYYLAGGEVPTWDVDQMRAFADATNTLRASHVQAPAGAGEPFGYFHQLLNHEGKGNGVWLGAAERKVVEQAHTPGETSEEIVALYTTPQPTQTQAVALPLTGEYPALVCDYCGALTPDPWHSSGMLHGKMSKHIHSCDACAPHGQAPAQPATVHCKGRNCAAVDGYGHSDECASDHELAASGLDTAGNRNPVARYDGYRGAPCNPAYTKDQQAAWLEGYEARNRQGITPTSGAADLRTAAQAVIDRWDTPLWKDVPATAEYIGRLRAALAAGQATNALRASHGQAPSGAGEAAEHYRNAIASARLLDSDLSNLTERGAKAWAGVDAQGLRDGGASLSANAGEPVATVFTMEALTPGGGVKYHATIHKALPAGTKLYTHTSPPEGMAGWMPIKTAPKDGSRILLHPAVEVADDWSKGHWNSEHKCWIVGGSPSGVVHTAWHHLPPAPSTEGEKP